MSKKGNELNGERLTKSFSSNPELLIGGGRTNQRSQNARKNNYAPNLNVVRNKNLDVKPSENNSTRGGGGRGRNQRGKNDRFNNSKRANPNLVQQVGFLSEGIADAATPRRSGTAGGFSSKESGAAVETIQKPRLRKNDPKTIKEDLEKEQQTLSKLLEESDEDSDESKAASDDIVPIKISHVGSETAFKFDNQEDVKVKLEPCDNFDVKTEATDYNQPSLNGNSGIKMEIGTKIKSEYYHRMDKLFCTDSNQVILFQMPDTLPQKLPDDEEEPTSKEEDEEPSKIKPMKLSSLEHFSEGVIGKLVRYRSGKTKMMIGEYMYEVETAIPTEFQQNAVSITSNVQERSANMYSIGQVSAKFNVIPDWNWLFDKVVKP